MANHYTVHLPSFILSLALVNLGLLLYWLAPHHHGLALAYSLITAMGLSSTLYNLWLLLVKPVKIGDLILLPRVIITAMCRFYTSLSPCTPTSTTLPIRHILDTVTLVVGGVLLGMCIPLLVWVPQCAVDRRAELAVVLALLTGFATVTLLYGVYSLFPAVAGRNARALSQRSNAVLVFILLAIGACIMGALTTWRLDLRLLKFSQYHSRVGDAQIARVEALVNGTFKSPFEHLDHKNRVRLHLELEFNSWTQPRYHQMYANFVTFL